MTSTPASISPFLALALATPLLAQGKVAVPGSEQYLMKAAANGVEYRIDVALPSGYATSTKRYPVFYILDGNLEFTTLLDAYRDLRIDASVPEMIVVGIGYPEDDPAVYTPAYHTSRSRDYTPTAVEAVLPGSGHGREFLRFLETELIPRIESGYRADSTDRGLGGHSLGGLFTTYTLLHRPGLFRRYWIGSPSLWWDHEVSFSFVDSAARATSKPRGRAFLTVGSLETALMVPPMERMAVRLGTTFRSLEVGSQVFADETHMSVIGGSVSRALRFLYAKPTVAIAAADRAGYLGRWKSAKGETITLVPKGAGVSLRMTVVGNPLTMDLFAESPDHLFAKAFQLELVAERDPSGKVIRLERTYVDGKVPFERAK